MQPTALPTKPHYPILDGLRGVAALMVVAFHLCEAHATSHLDQLINHGYLAVDFFFLLSGFVVGYAYDDRWSRMTVGGFFRRRLVRLQPLVVLGMVIGAIFYYFQESALWPAIAQTPPWKVLLVMLIGCLTIPVPLSLDVRGWHETFPLNGPGWSLFFEYVANVLYATVVRRFSNVALGILVVLSAGLLLHLGVTSPEGDVIGGWSLEPRQLHVGFARMLYPFFAGLLLFRLARLGSVSNAFGWCSLLVVVVLAMPRIGSPAHLWQNGLYDALSIIIVFPGIIFLAASGAVHSAWSQRLCRFLGDISYPIYITHYPLIYTYTAWVATNKVPLRNGWPVAALVFVAAVAIAYASLKFYDEPVRAWLKRKVLADGSEAGKKAVAAAVK
ncbi:acyltransferase [Hymenobacter sp. DH14]|uniref:Acyltransferase n=1 Tax=Hymenobacter cyanobacteriorum TaxID=2926463 RepID=A0A9X1VFS7_9BACT|nr:acyltransferase [Hymenobacter cyanobacteriorum]MCI1187770.1 acyltransferase [Hymenobacter cyanobacteriorum]